MLKILGCALFALPFILITAEMWRRDGIECVLVVWGITLFILAILGAGVWCLCQ